MGGARETDAPNWSNSLQNMFGDFMHTMGGLRASMSVPGPMTSAVAADPAWARNAEIDVEIGGRIEQQRAAERVDDDEQPEGGAWEQLVDIERGDILVEAAEAEESISSARRPNSVSVNPQGAQ